MTTGGDAPRSGAITVDAIYPPTVEDIARPAAV
jgi:hypothetical protein